jgi:hypothetical protein
VAGFAVLFKAAPVTNRRVALAAFVTILAMAAVFFASQTKAPTYLIPIYPFAAVIIALAFASIKPAVPYYVLLVAGVVGIVWSTQFAVYNAYYHNPYFSVVRDIARDEHAIAELLKRTPQNQVAYAYRTISLGSIFYYSQHFAVWSITPTTTLPGAAYVLLANTDREAFAQDFPHISTVFAYEGKQVSLLEVVSED